MYDERYQLQNYAITGDPEEADHNQHYSEEIEEQLRKTYLLIAKKKRDLLPRLQKLIKKYPRVPAFKNYLSTYYSQKGNIEKAFEVNRWLCKEHPNYLHGKINLAAQHLQEENYEKVPEILGEALDLQDLYPERKVFHSSEFAGFFNVTCQYLIATNQLEAAESRLEVAADILPSKSTTHIRMMILTKRMESFQERQAEEEKNARTPEVREYDKTVQTTEKPSFHHPEIEYLYNEDLSIDVATLNEILALPRASLIADLEKVLKDSIARFEFFENLAMEEGWFEDTMSFPLHAMALLGELKATKSLPTFLEVLRQGEDFLEFWFSDHTTETLWEFVYHIGEGQLETLRDFLYERNIYYQGKSAVTTAVFQVSEHQPERKQEVIEWYKEVLSYYLNNIEDKDLIDSELISFIAWEAGDLKAEELLALVEKCYEQKLIHHTILGDYKEYKKSFFEEARISPKRNIYSSTFEKYQDILKAWSSYQSEEEQEGGLWDEKMGQLESGEFRIPTSEQSTNSEWMPATVKRETPKVGRNEPCPCGSGKKYKKCCLKKG